VVIVILVSFVIFSANGMSGAIADVGAMFGAGNLPFWTAETGYYLSSYAVVFACAVFGATPVLKNTVLKLKENKTANAIINVLEPIVVVVLLLCVTAYFVDGSFSPFLYFRF
jgi:alginate O-acetyltransferase complex protein AlgI